MKDGEKLKHIRGLLRLTQDEMAEKLGITQQALSHLESGRNVEMSYGVFKSLVNKCGVNPYYILGTGKGESEFSPKSADQNKVLREKIKQYDELIDRLLALRIGKK